MKLLSLLLTSAAALFAGVRLPALISDNMVLQQGQPVRIWGFASDGESVTVTFLGQSVTARTSGGRWQAFLPPMAAGGPYDMTITGSNTITIGNVLVGEVWVASGQSNMAWPLSRSTNAEKESAAANYPGIRFFHVKTSVAAQPADDVTGSWKVCTPENVPSFSGVGYFFARDLHQNRRVPIGVIQSAVGGTPAQAWTSKAALDSNKILHWYLERWSQFQAEYEAKKEEGKPAAEKPAPMGAPGHNHTPSGLYNGMIAPLTPYAIRGAIWYQGEANAGPTDNELYRTLFAEMIRDWRKAWNSGPLPFLWVQLAGFNPPGGRQWAVIRDSQTATLDLRNTGQALAIDVGEPDDIHPKDKLTVGKRLALAARAVAYGENVVHSGPRLRQVSRDGDRLRLWFDHTGSGLQARTGHSLTGFRIAGVNRMFTAAEARVDGDTVVVSNSGISDPVAVRYAWENYPAANLANREGLPAVPFRTDDWSEGGN